MSLTMRSLICLAAFAAGSGTALAQATPVPGSVDATKASANTREEREEFNRAAGRLNRRALKQAVPATAADIKSGLAVHDSKGYLIGNIEAVEADGAIVASPQFRVRVPLEGFGKNKAGLILGMTKAEFEAAAAAVTAKPAG
jgi:hypothetical protein